MKRQDVSGVERLAVDSTGGGGGSDVNLTGINGTAPSVNNGTADAGTLRVTVASDSTGQIKLAAGTALAGKVGIDQTTPGTTNAVSVSQIGATTVATGNGVVGTGVQRVAIASDNTAFAVTVSGTVTASNVTGNVASDAVDSGNPVKVGWLAKTADITAVSDADRVDGIASTLGKQIGLPYAVPALTWSYAAAAGGLVTTGGVTAKTAGTGSQRQYITSVQAINSHQTISTEVVIRDGASGTVLWRGWAQAAGGGCAARFDPPLRGSAATLVEIAEITATATAGVLMSVQGYTASE